MGRDHSIECYRCGMWYGGMSGPDYCECPDGPQPVFDPASINLTSCDFVGDMGCSDESCTRCHGDALPAPQSDDRPFERDPAGLADNADHVPAKPCCARMNTIPISWCTRTPGHSGPCSAPPVRPIELDDLGPGASKRRRW